MLKQINFKNKILILIFLFALSIPTFYRMFNFGIYSMQDFHFFRLFEFDKCIQNFQIPCRWAPDAGLGYGEPLFNFYGQLGYVIGEVFHLIGFNIINSLKIVFALSLVGSTISMFFLARKIWANNYAALISSIIYVYAPYRAVDIWVRGALPEALSFMLFPLIILSIEERSIVWLSVTLSVLILTHNLSFVMFLPFLLIWIFYRKFWKGLVGIILSTLISAFYVLPVVFESKFVNIQSTIQGYFDYRTHFITLYQIFISRFWGYGGSTWGAGDGLSLSVGLIQWIIPVIIFIWLILNKKIKAHIEFLIIFTLGWFYLFLTHNKSTFIWENLKFMAYIQFPWRFLGMATFCFALSAGLVVSLLEKQKLALISVVIFLAIVLNFSFFKEDIWYKVNDSYFTTGAEWDRQRTASIGDFWPNFGHLIPSGPSDGMYINYFPGWIPETYENGIIPTKGSVFKDTPIRRIGNWISIISILGLGFVVAKNIHTKNK